MTKVSYCSVFMKDTQTSVDTEVKIEDIVPVETNSGPAVATLVKEPMVEEEFTPGELKWTADKAIEEQEIIPEEPVSEQLNLPVVVAQPPVEVQSSTSENVNKKWIWIASFSVIFLVSFLFGYTVLGNRYWREVFDIHTWIHTLKLIFG